MNQCNDDILKCLAETRINNSTVIDQNTYQTTSFVDRVADSSAINALVTSIKAKGHKACVIENDTATNETLRPFSYVDKYTKGSNFHLVFAINQSSINADHLDRCLLQTGKSDRNKISDLLISFLRRLFDDRIVDSIRLSSISLNRGHFLIDVIIDPVSVGGGTADVVLYVNSFNMFPRTNTPSSSGTPRMVIDWLIFVSTVNSLISSGSIKKGSSFLTSDICGVKYKVIF